MHSGAGHHRARPVTSGRPGQAAASNDGAGNSIGPAGAGHRAQPGQAAAPSDGAGNSTDTADAANKRQEAQRRGQIFLAATCYTGKGIVIDGVLHLFDVNPPSHCLVDRDVLKQSSKVSPGDGDFMVYVHTPEWNHQIPQLLKVIARDVMPSNKQGTLFKLSHIENWAGLGWRRGALWWISTLRSSGRGWNTRRGSSIVTVAHFTSVGPKVWMKYTNGGQRWQRPFQVRMVVVVVVVDV